MSHDHNSAGAAHGNFKQYTIGFILSVILTIIPFGMVMSGGFERGLLVTVIAITAAAQVLVQLVFFLHECLFRTALERNCFYLYCPMYCNFTCRLGMDYELPSLQHDDLNWSSC